MNDKYLRLWIRIETSRWSYIFHGGSQTAIITRCTLKAACWLLLGCWDNNVANSHLSPGAFNNRVLRSCLVLQCSHSHHWPCHYDTLRKVRLDACVLHQRTIFLSSRASNLLRFVTYGASLWILDLCSNQRSSVPVAQPEWGRRGYASPSPKQIC